MTFKKKIGAMYRNDEGATAVEFAMVAVVFLMLFMGIIEYGMYMFAQVTVESAVTQAGRVVSIGTTSAGCDRACTAIQIIKDKTGGLPHHAEVQAAANTVAAGGTVVPDICIDDTANPTINPPGGVCHSFIPVNSIPGFQGAGCTNVGNANDVVEIRASYPWHVLFPLFSEFFGNGGIVMITSTTVFKNQPFPTSNGKSC